MSAEKYFIIFLCLFIAMQGYAQTNWAEKVEKHSDDQPDAHHVQAILGKPDVNRYGILHSKAWTSNFEKRNYDKPHWIKVSFDAIQVKKIWIVENYGVSIKKIYLYDESDKMQAEFVVNDNLDTSMGMTGKISYVTLSKLTPYKVKYIKLEIFSPLYENLSQVDAIGIQDHELPYEETNDANLQTEVATQNLKSKYILSGTVSVEGTNNPLGNAEVQITDLQTNDSQIVFTDASGSFKAELDRASHYAIEATKSKYFKSKKKSVSTTGKKYIDPFGVEIEMRAMLLNAVYQIPNIQFGINSAEPTEDSYPSLNDFAMFLANNNTVRVSIEVHTDSRGNDEYNLELTQKRSEAIINYLAQKGIQKSRMIGKGYGETRLLNDCQNGVNCTSEEHLQNRRVEFRVVGFL